MSEQISAWETDGRWRRLCVSSELLSAFFRNLLGVPAVWTDAPVDLTFVGLVEVTTGPNGSYTFMVWSMSFDPLPMTDGLLNDDIPIVSFVYRR